MITKNLKSMKEMIKFWTKKINTNLQQMQKTSWHNLGMTFLDLHSWWL